MKILRVKIVKVRHDHFWYAPYIGEEFFVEDIFVEDDDDRPRKESYWRYRVIPNGIYFQRPINEYIRNDDVEILEEFEGHVDESIIVTFTIERD
jgi:hypothetical protein